MQMTFYFVLMTTSAECNESIKNTYKIVDLVSQAWFYRAFIYQNSTCPLFLWKNPFLRV